MSLSAFGAATFDVLREDVTARLPRWGRQWQVAVHPIPNGTDDATQLLGHGARRVTWRLWMTEAEYVALEALVQTSATLSLGGVSQGTCVLLSLEPEGEWDATGANVFCVATFRAAT